MFSDKDLEQIKRQGLELKVVENQIKNFKNDFPAVKLVGAASPGNGLKQLNKDELHDLIEYFDTNYKSYDILKFVPASGAASRMFKHLHEFMNLYTGSNEDIEQFEADKSFNSVFNFFDKLNKFAFYDDLKSLIEKDGKSLDNLLSQKKYTEILQYFLNEDGLNYSSLPKGLLKFHYYEEGSRLAVEEHLVEAAIYSRDKDNIARIHLTVSPNHEEKFKSAVAEKSKKFEDKFGVKYEVHFSQQMPFTDMIAVDMENNPFRLDDGSLLFRPGGHGALIENLNQLDNEIVFIKNIDNIVPDRLRQTTYDYKKAIGAMLMKLQDKTFDYLEILEDGNLDKDTIEEIKAFAENQLFINIPNAYLGYDEMEKIDFLFTKLNRPIRICGMVKNEGEPGGGPFWVKNSVGEISLQIVESSQMDLNKEDQKEIVSSATHFNPVDLICGLKNYKGNKFDLKDYVDPQTGFISTKSLAGRDLKAQELPGLWNGAMADWITIFVETPIITFNPVKTINDLLRPQHQPDN